MLELGLHFSSAMNSVSGLRFSIPYLTGRFPCRSPLLLSPFRWNLRARVIIRLVLLGFWAFTTIELWTSITFIVFIAFWPLGFYLSFMIFRISDFRFMSNFLFWMLSLLGLRALCHRIDFILWWRILLLFWLCYSFIFPLLSIYYILKVTGVTFWYQCGFRPGSDPGWRFWRLGFIRFKQFLTISKYFGDLEVLKMKINRTFPFRITPF